jgi:tetratricopeptide (TPR) repeat protein
VKKAATEYQKTIELKPDLAEAHYNLGLLYVDLGDYAKARKEADIAYAAGYPLQGLKNKLARAPSASHSSAASKPSTSPAE